MCIFNEDVVAVQKTIILGGQTTHNTHFMVYQNQVTSKTKNVMMLPIPTSNPNIVFHDTTPYKDFATYIGKIIYKKENKGIDRSLDKSVEDGYKTIGQYRYKLVDNIMLRREIELLDLEVKPWLDQFERHYANFKWLFCIMDANTSMESQPLLVEYTPNNPSEFFFPMMDVHGDDVVDSVVFRDHLIGLASPTPLKGDSEQFEGIDNRFFAHDYFWDYTQVKGRVKNGDMVIKHTPEEEKKLHLSYKFLAV